MKTKVKGVDYGVEVETLVDTTGGFVCETCGAGHAHAIDQTNNGCLHLCTVCLSKVFTVCVSHSIHNSVYTSIGSIGALLSDAFDAGWMAKSKLKHEGTEQQRMKCKLDYMRKLKDTSNDE